MLTVIEIHISHLRFNLKVIRIYHIQRFLSANFFLPKKNYLIFGNLLKIAQISKKKIPKNFFNGVEVIIIKKIYWKIKKKADALI